MDYIYDIVLNFQNEYYDFYEWFPADKIINMKRVPIYKVTNEDYLKIKNNIVTIERKSLPKPNKIFLITSGLEVMGILIDNAGHVIKKSSLLFEEADEVLEDKDLLKKINIKYNIDTEKSIKYISRIKKDKSKYINNYLKKINKYKDEYFLKYLYFEIFNEDENNINKVYNTLIELSKKDIDKMYESIKKIELELKKLP